MSSKPTVTLTLAGDEEKLTRAFDRVGEASESMADRVDSSSKKMDDAGSGLDSLGDKTDASEQKFQGLADTITGTGDIMTGFREGDIVGMATGFADLAGGLTDFLIPAISSMASFLAGPLRAAMSFIAAHPLLITLGVLIALFVTLWTTSETFRNVVIRAFNAVGGFIKGVFGGAIGWIVDRWNGIVSFFSGLPGRIGSALGGLAGIVKNVFKGVVNTVVDALNWFLDHTINWLINRVNDISGVIGIPAIPTIPHIPRMHGGGVVSGMLGTEQLRVLQAGERVIPRGQDGNGGTATVMFGGDVDSAFATAFMNLVRRGDITLAVG